ncbi:MAG: dephospho-CoA kinase [Clostridia bacterium]|nr:dephospho-CoA kinase [Clostridia bacterium]
MAKKAKIIALTGGIGSGKTSALDVLSTAGYPVLSSDEIVHELYEKRSVKKLLKSIFPDAVKGFINLKIDKRRIAELAFSNKALHKKLTDTVTPLVLKEILRRTENANQNTFVEVPLLFECGYQDYFDGVLVITRDRAQRIESVKVRSNLTEQEIIARMNEQTDYDAFDLTPYTVINNDGDFSTLKEKVLTFAKNL